MSRFTHQRSNHVSPTSIAAGLDKGPDASLFDLGDLARHAHRADSVVRQANAPGARSGHVRDGAGRHAP